MSVEYRAPLKRMPQLDGLRGLAIFGVLVAHWVTPAIGMTLPYGTMGVRLFFVLSGFLITGILLRAKNDQKEGRQSLGYSLWNFYARRSLRIFAVYYLYILITVGFLGMHRERWLWDVFYVSNFYDILKNDGYGLHYWSLAVEEQFYLVWPLLVLMLPERWLLRTFWAVVGLAIATRTGLAASDVDYLKIKKFTPTCMDALSMGAITAYLLMRDGPGSFSLRRLTRWSLVVGGSIFVAALVALHTAGKEHFVYSAGVHTGLAFLGTAVLIPAISGYSGFVGRCLTLRPLMWIGTVSYALYLMHMEAPRIVVWAMAKTGLDFPASPMIAAVTKFCIYTSVAILMAAVSWYGFERYVNSLKKFFPMSKNSTPQINVK